MLHRRLQGELPRKSIERRVMNYSSGLNANGRYRHPRMTDYCQGLGEVSRSHVEIPKRSS
ncbi:hypothetical protein SPHV1_140024 [Novosphingobium sp. KN65.2]|nr:hypothetical protein SPHV1_140024 [Novosphingobium sp. KN65.2]